MHNVNSQVTVSLFLAADARAASENGTGVDLKDYIGIGKVIMDSELGSGTTPTMTIKLQHSDDNGVADSWADITDKSFDEVTDAANDGVQELALDIDAVRRYVRAVATIGGTNYPTFVSNCILLAKNRKSLNVNHFAGVNKMVNVLLAPAKP